MKYVVNRVKRRRQTVGGSYIPLVRVDLHNVGEYNYLKSRNVRGSERAAKMRCPLRSITRTTFDACFTCQ